MNIEIIIISRSYIIMYVNHNSQYINKSYTIDAALHNNENILQNLL